MSRFTKTTRTMSAAAAAAPKAVPRVAAAATTTVPQQTQYKHAECYSKSSDLTVVEGKGCYVWDTNGNRYLDVTSGIAVLSTGHCHPRVVERLQEQAGKLLHGQLNCFQSHPQLDELMMRVGEVMPEGLDRFFVDTTGTQAIEAAVKLARRHTGRPNIVCMSGGFHGRSALTTAMTSSNTGPRFPRAMPLPSGVYHVDPPLAFHWGVSREEAVARAVKEFEDLFVSKVPADQVAAVLFEPVLGEGGFLPIDPEYANRVKKICDEHGILTISDEVQAGMGRTGKMWGCQFFDYTPDILVSAKGLASGMPLSLVAAKKDVMAAYTPGTHGGTYMGNAMACASANATLEVIKEEGLVENAAQQGRVMKKLLTDLRNEYFPRGDVRGMGCMIGLEMIDDDGTPSAELARHVRTHALQNGVLIYAASGWRGNCLRIMPPLIVQEHEVMQLMATIEGGLKSWRQNRPAASA